MSQTGRSIPVVRAIRVRKDRVRFPAARPEGRHPNGLSYSGSTQGWGSCSPGPIPGESTEIRSAATIFRRMPCADTAPQKTKDRQRGLLFLRAKKSVYFIPTILYFCAPLGVSNEKVSPFFFSIREEPSGERCDILCSCILASAEPTIW